MRAMHSTGDADLQRTVAAMLARRRGEIVATMVREMQEGVPGYWMMRSAALQADLQSAVATICDTFITLLAEDRALSEQEERVLRVIGARRARQGIAVQVLRGAVLVASRVGWRYVVECFSELDPAVPAVATMGRVGERLGAFCQAALQLLTSAYHTAASQGADHGEMLAQAIAGGGGQGGAPNAMLAERFGPEVYRPHRLLLVTAFDPCADVVEGITRATVAEILELVPDAVEVPVTSSSTGHATVAAPSLAHGWRSHRPALEELAARHAALIFASGTASGPVHLRRAYERSCTLLRLARGARSAPGLVEPADLRLHNLVVEGMEDHDEFVEEVLGRVLRLPPQHRDKLLRTIASLGDVPLRGGLRAASKALGVHEKTVAYRMERIVELTGLDPDLPRHRMQLVVATDLLRLSGWRQSQGAGRVLHIDGVAVSRRGTARRPLPVSATAGAAR